MPESTPLLTKSKVQPPDKVKAVNFLIKRNVKARALYDKYFDLVLLIRKKYKFAPELVAYGDLVHLCEFLNCFIKRGGDSLLEPEK